MGGNGMRFSVRLALTRSSTSGRAAALARTLMAVGSAVTLAAGVAAAAAPASAAVSGWHIQHTPGLPPRQGALAADSCASATACVAVGSYQDGNLGFPLAERWNGTSWSLLKPRIPKGAVNTSLLGVSCASASDCVTVGTYDNANGTYFTLAEVWHGGSWSIQRTPSRAHTSTSLAASWSIQNPAAGGPGDSGLYGVSCVSASDCIAVGFAGEALMADRWDGTSWSAQPVPVPAGTRNSLLDGLSCVPAGTCTAVGYWQNRSGNQSVLVERWNGTAWSVQPAPDPGTNGASLAAVSCVSASACTTVGFYDTNSGGQRTLAEVWDGTAWSVQPTANPANAGSQLNGVACHAPGTCTAVGDNSSPPDSHGSYGSATLAEAEP